MLQDPRVAWEGDKWDVGGASGMAASRDGNLVRHRFAAKMKTPLLLSPFGSFVLFACFLLIFCVFPRAQLSSACRKRVGELNWNLLEMHWAGSNVLKRLKRAVYPC